MVIGDGELLIMVQVDLFKLVEKSLIEIETQGEYMLGSYQQ